tara:strand:+ start:38 stop:601 length:564 start_codon:yes stop_codon:yes gene_type:complete
METINIEDQCLLYFFYNKKEKVYIGETSKGYGRFYQHKDKKFDKHNVKYISGKKLNFLNNEYFRKYYELRLINRFKPKYNKEKTIAPTLNDFICKMFLWYENPNPTFINPLTAYNQIKYNKYFEYRTKQRRIKKVLNQYTNVWKNLDMSKKLYIDGQNAFNFLINETMKPTNNYSIKFTPRKERLHN